MHHDLDIHPIPEKVLYINDLTIADTAPYYETTKQYEKALTRNLKNAVRINDNIHSPRGIQLAKEIISILMEDEGCAESFPYNIIAELQAEFGI